MAVKWLIGLSMAFILLTIGSGVLEQTYLGTAEAGVFWQAISSFQAVSISDPITAIWSIMVGAWSMIQALFKMLIWDYAFFIDDYLVFRYLFMSISVGMVVSLLLAIRGTSSA